MTDLSEYRALFLEELDEQLQYIEEEVLRLEHEGATDTAVDRLFRAAHTLKGSSAAMGYHKMKEVTHQLEHLLHQVRNGERTVTKPLINLMFTGLDVMKGLQAEIVRTDAETSDISPLLQQLQQFSMNAASESVIPEPPNAFSGGAKEELPGDVGQPPAQRSVYTETKSKSQTIRVNIERLDHLMNLAGELVIDQTRIQQVNTLFRQRFGSDDLVEELFQLSDHLSLLIGELQDGVMKARMLPIEQLYNRFPRMIRDLAESLGKQVDLILQGKDTELDRTLIEEIGDPLIHLLRNAVDHGIEAPEQRRLSGKSERGTVTLSSAHQDNHVVISIRDDGAGIDADKLRGSAVSKGLLSQTEARRLSDEEALQLIFKPGFSTASAVSDVSGRGVGMDIVRNNIERMSGMIDVETVKGQGTLFRIRLPLTLAIVTGLLVNISGRVFIIPMSSVAEITRIEAKEIKRLRGKPVIKIRHQVIPVIWLHDHFQYPRPPVRRYLPMVIIGRGEKRAALAVDELMGNQEIVIKSLGSFIGKIGGISGATILGSGNVALILDVESVVKLSDHAQANSSI